MTDDEAFTDEGREPAVAWRADTEEPDLEEPDLEEPDLEEPDLEEPEDVEGADVEGEDAEDLDIEEEDVEEEDVEGEDAEDLDIEEEDVEGEGVEDPDIEEGDLEEEDLEAPLADLGVQGDYGIDAPAVVRALAYGAVGAGFVMFVAALVNVTIVMGVALAVCLVLGLVALTMLSSSRSGKLRERVRVVDAAGLDDDDFVLDLGCGRGLLLVEAARRVPDGLAVGVDLWDDTDQSANEPLAPLDNAVIERVDDRVVVATADARRLPFAGGSFDAVTSSMTIHNIDDGPGRAEAIREAARVLRPGGRLVILDMRGTRAYVKTLRALGWTDVKRSGRIWRMFPPVRAVRATKPTP